MSDINTANDFFLGTDGTKITAMRTVAITTREQAFRTAAWLEVMAITLPHDENEDPVTFDDIREAIRNT